VADGVRLGVGVEDTFGVGVTGRGREVGGKGDGVAVAEGVGKIGWTFAGWQAVSKTKRTGKTNGIRLPKINILPWQSLEAWNRRIDAVLR